MGGAGKKKVTSIHPHLRTSPTHFPFQNTAVHLPLNTKAKLITNKTICFRLYSSKKIKYHKFAVCFIVLLLCPTELITECTC